MFWFIVGFVFGFLIVSWVMTTKIVGNLKYVIDDGDVHFFMQIPDPDVGNILSKGFVVLKVDSKPSQN